MTLTEETQVPDAVLPVVEFRRHLRMGSGFEEDDLQDGVLAVFLRAAMAAIEARTMKALIARTFLLELSETPRHEALSVPIAPLTALLSVEHVAADDVVTSLPVEDVRLVRDAHEPRVVRLRGCWPTLAAGERLRLRLSAGMAAGWDALPADLAHAVMLLAAHYYEFRTEARMEEAVMPFGVSGLLARYQVLRLRAGR